MSLISILFLTFFCFSLNITCQEDGQDTPVQSEISAEIANPTDIINLNEEGSTSTESTDISAEIEIPTEIYNLTEPECGMPSVLPITKQEEGFESRIIGGSEARPHSWPWQVSIQRKQSTGEFMHVCGGTLISPSKVLSALHCLIHSQKPEDYIVRLGVHNMNDPNEDVTVVNVAYFEWTEANNLKQMIIPEDLVVITLSPEVNYTDSIMPACLPVTKGYSVRDRLCYTTGWGKNESFFSSVSSNSLQQLEIPIQDDDMCRRLYKSKDRPFRRSRMICAGNLEGGKDTCQGDSGGPLVCSIDRKWTLVGVTSFGKECALKNTPATYTKISAFLDYLNNIFHPQNDAEPSTS